MLLFADATCIKDTRLFDRYEIGLHGDIIYVLNSFLLLLIDMVDFTQRLFMGGTTLTAAMPIRKLKSWKDLSLYRKLIVTMMLIAIFPHFLMSSIAYFNVSATLQEESGNNNMKYLKQTINAVEIVVQQILDSSQQLVLSRSFRDFESFPNRYYYETMSGAFEQHELPVHYSYLLNKQSVVDNMRIFKLSNAFVDSVYFYERENNLVLAVNNDNSSTTVPFDEFYDKDWYDPLNSSILSPIFMDTRSASRDSGDKFNALTIVFKTNAKDNAILINLDAEKIYHHIINKINPKDDLYVTNGDGRILLNKNAAHLHRNIRSLFAEADKTESSGSSFQSKFDGKKVLVSNYTSEILHWTFFNVVNLDELLNSLTYLKRTILFSAAFLLLLTVLLSVLSSKRLYRPIAITINERDYFKEKLEESLPYYRERFKLSLLKGQAGTTVEIAEKMAYLQLNISAPPLMVFVVSFDPDRPGGGPDNAAASDMNNIRVIDAIDNSAAFKSGSFITVDAAPDSVAIILTAEDMDLAGVFHLAQTLLEELERKLNNRLSIGIGRQCITIAELPKSYEEAEEALKYRMLLGGSQVIYIDDVVIDGQIHFKYPNRKAELLCGYVKTGNSAEANRIFDEIASEIALGKNKLHYNEILPIFVRLLTDIVGTLSALGADPQQVFKNGGNPYRTLVEQKSLEQIETWFRHFIAQAADYVGEEMKVKGNHHITKVQHILERDYANDISLQSVSEQLNLNPAYVSRLFKQISGKSFVEYVTALRMEKSKEMLVQSEMKVNEIGRQVGYQNAYYFIKVFKEYTGVTPGEYRKLFG